MQHRESLRRRSHPEQPCSGVPLGSADAPDTKIGRAVKHVSRLFDLGFPGIIKGPLESVVVVAAEQEGFLLKCSSCSVKPESRQTGLSFCKLCHLAANNAKLLSGKCNFVRIV